MRKDPFKDVFEVASFLLLFDRQGVHSRVSLLNLRTSKNLSCRLGRNFEAKRSFSALFKCLSSLKSCKLNKLLSLSMFDHTFKL